MSDTYPTPLPLPYSMGTGTLGEIEELKSYSNDRPICCFMEELILGGRVKVVKIFTALIFNGLEKQVPNSCVVDNWTQAGSGLYLSQPQFVSLGNSRLYAINDVGAAKILANLIVMGSGILARAFVQAYRQALAIQID
ncbi:hypothetical protein CsSME_00034270 [Camellia sinensis var. sinensis]